MKKALLTAAALLVGVAATAQPPHPAPGHRQVVTHRETTTVVHREQGLRVPILHKHKVCRTVWRNHHRVSSCSWR